MAKRKSSGIVGLCVTFTAILLALVAFFLMFAPAIGDKAGTTYTGAQIAFGFKETYRSASLQALNFSFMNFLPYLLLLIGVAFGILVLFGKLKFISKIVSAGCFIAAGVFFFCAVQFTMPADTALGLLIGLAKDNQELSLKAGVIVSGVLSLLAGLASLSALFIKK